MLRENEESAVAPCVSQKKQILRWRSERNRFLNRHACPQSAVSPMSQKVRRLG
jgi:hypothetical protein